MNLREKIFDNMLDVFARFSFPSEKVFYLQNCWDRAYEVFDLGCGNASYTAMLAESHKDKHFTCAEIDPVLSEIAQRRIANSGIDIIKGSYENVNNDYKFDFLLARLVITHINNMHSFVEWLDRHSAPDAGILVIDTDIENFDLGPDLPIFSKLFESQSKENNFGGLTGLSKKTMQIFEGSSLLHNSTQLVKLEASSKRTKELMYTYMKNVAELGLGTPLPPSLNLELLSWLENPDSRLQLSLFGSTFIKKSDTSRSIKNSKLSEPEKNNSRPLDCLHDFDDCMRKVLSDCRKKILLYPESLRQSGLDFLEDYDIFNKNSSKNYISYLLPFWLQPYFSIDCSDLIKLSAGNTFLMLYAILQDDVMDAAPGECNANILPLGNLFFLDFLSYYRSLFPSDSVVWKYLDTYFAQWADSVTWEHRQHWGQLKEFTLSDIKMLAGKAAPLKVSCAAACLMCNKETDLEPLCSKVDYTFILLQLLDDWADWQEDMLAGNCTYLLSEAMKYSKVDSLSNLTVSQFTDAVFLGNILEKVFSIVNDASQIIKNKTDLYLPYLDAFIEVLLKNCNDIISEVQAEKASRLQGGFEYWLFKNGIY